MMEPEHDSESLPQPVPRWVAVIFGLLLLLIMSLSSARGDESPCISDPPLLRELVKAYAERTATKFVLDPRVRAKVQLFGMDPSHIDYVSLVSIFNIHGFTAIESAGVIYVVPEVGAAEMKRRLDARDERR